MTEIQNPPQKKRSAHAAQAPALRVEPVWNLMLEIYLEFGTWNL